MAGAGGRAVSIREQFRGAARDRYVVKPIDPSLPHRFVEQPVGRAGTCVFCAGRRGNPLHDPDARQNTVDIRDGEIV